MKAALRSAGRGEKSNETGNDEAATARKAVVEGQAMVVYVDYLLAPMDAIWWIRPVSSIRWRSLR